MNEIRTTITYNLPILRKYMIFVRIYNLFGFPVGGRTNRYGNETNITSRRARMHTFSILARLLKKCLSFKSFSDFSSLYVRYISNT